LGQLLDRSEAGSYLSAMKEKILITGVLSFFIGTSALQAAPSFWNPSGTQTPTPVAAPPILVPSDSAQGMTATPTAVVAPVVGIVTATPTPEPGVHHKDPTAAAVFSLVIPGAGQVYDDDPLKGLAFAAVFGVSLWQAIDNLQLHPDPNDHTPANQGGPAELVKNEDLGSLFGLLTLVTYGFGIEDALDGAVDYNRRHFVSLSLGLQPMASASISYHF
jgi:hypothetical protein